MYCLPPNTMQGIAYATINSWNSVYSNEWCTYVSAQVHEIGHNLNLAHSNERGIEYDDRSGLMGFSYPFSDAPQMCFNSAKSWQLQWYRSRHLELDSISRTAYRGELASILEDPDQISAIPMLVKINNGNTDYFELHQF